MAFSLPSKQPCGQLDLGLWVPRKEKEYISVKEMPSLQYCVPATEEMNIDFNHKKGIVSIP